MILELKNALVASAAIVERLQSSGQGDLTDYAHTFLIERWNIRGLRGKKKIESCLFAARVGIFSFLGIIFEMFSLTLYLDLAC